MLPFAWAGAGRVAAAPPAPAGIPAAEAAPRNAVGDAAPSISYTLSSVNDWSEAMPFLDLMRTSRPWAGRYPDGADGAEVGNAELAAAGHLDENGWVRSLPEGVAYAETVFDWRGSPGAAPSRAGRYVLSHAGEGVIEVGWGASVVSRAPGRIVIDNPAGSIFSIRILDPDLRDDGNHVRAMTLVAERDLPLFEAGATFNPRWIAVVGDAADLRFMDWGNTNGSTLSSWADRPRPADATYAGRFGVPIEVMIALCNQVGADLWLNIPHLADDGYVRGAAALVRDGLDPRLSVHVEYSNEAWNWAFAQAHHMLEMARRTFGNDAAHDYQSYRATQVAMIFESVFAQAPAEAPELLNVFGVQTGGLWTGTKALEAGSWRDRTASGAMQAPGEVFDQIGIAPYFGGSIVSHADSRGQLLALIRGGAPQQRIDAWLHGRLIDPRVEDSVPATLAMLRAWKAVADGYGMELVAYEGGQHVHHSFAVEGLSDAEAVEMSDALAAFVRSPQMADLYLRSAAVWKQVSDQPFMQFGDVGAPGRWGSWAILAHLGDDNPRHRALTGPIAAMIGGAADPAHQNGIHHLGTDAAETIRGTPEEDFIAAGAGADRIVPGGGDDGVHGGPGVDTVVVSGAMAGHALRFEGEVAILEGKGVGVRMVGVERLTFADRADVPVSRGGLPGGAGGK